MKGKISYYLMSILLAFYILFLNYCLAYSNNEPDIRNKLHELYEVTGIQNIVESFADQFIEGLRSQEEIGGFGVIEEMAYDSFNEDKMYSFIDKEFIDHWDVDYVDIIIADLKKPLFEEFSKKEEFAATEEGLAEYSKYRQNYLNEHYASKERVELIKKLNVLKGDVELAVETYMELSRIMFVSFNEMTDIDARLSEAEIEERIADLKEKTESGVEQNMLIFDLFVYKSFSDEDLNVYIKFYETDAVQWLIAQFNQGYINALKSGGKMFGDGLVKYFNDHKEEFEGSEEE